MASIVCTVSVACLFLVTFMCKYIVCTEIEHIHLHTHMHPHSSLKYLTDKVMCRQHKYWWIKWRAHCSWVLCNKHHCNKVHKQFLLCHLSPVCKVNCDMSEDKMHPITRAWVWSWEKDYEHESFLLSMWWSPYSLNNDLMCCLAQCDTASTHPFLNDTLICTYIHT